MKHYILLFILCISMFALRAQQYVFVKCHSGDCVNGNGTASFDNKAQFGEGAVTYTGSFKDGKMSGQGTIVNSHHYYSGSVENNFPKGYGSLFYAKAAGDGYVADSAGYVDIGEWDGDGCKRVISVQSDGLKVYNSNTEGEKYHKKFSKDLKVLMADPWISQHVSAVLSSSMRPHLSQYEEAVIAQKTFTARKGDAIQLIEWDCLPDRKYYVTAGAVNKGTYTIMPFGGYVNYQVIAEDGTVAFEGSADRYWTPLKAGKYKFMVMFDQSAAAGNGNVSVDQVTLACSLRSKRQTN